MSSLKAALAGMILYFIACLVVTLALFLSGMDRLLAYIVASQTILGLAIFFTQYEGRE